MTPEIRKKLENNTIPFGLMEPELQEALRAARESGHEVQVYSGIYTARWGAHTDPTLFAMHTYRLASSGLVIPDALWELLNKKYVAIAKQTNGTILPYTSKPKTSFGLWNGAVYGPRLDTLVPNLDPHDCDWRNSLVMRPGYEED